MCRLGDSTPAMLLYFCHFTGVLPSLITLALFTSHSPVEVHRPCLARYRDGPLDS